MLRSSFANKCATQPLPTPSSNEVSAASSCPKLNNDQQNTGTSWEECAQCNATLKCVYKVGLARKGTRKLEKLRNCRRVVVRVDGGGRRNSVCWGSLEELLAEPLSLFSSTWNVIKGPDGQVSRLYVSPMWNCCCVVVARSSQAKRLSTFLA